MHEVLSEWLEWHQIVHMLYKTGSLKKGMKSLLLVLDLSSCVFDFSTCFFLD
jgi:hypothetical protein